MAMRVPAAPQASSTPRLSQSNPVCWANGPIRARLNGRTGRAPEMRFVGVNRHVAAGEEDQGEQNQLHNRRRGLGIADEGGHGDAQRAETGRPEDER